MEGWAGVAEIVRGGRRGLLRVVFLENARGRLGLDLELFMRSCTMADVICLIVWVVARRRYSVGYTCNDWGGTRLQ